jgi:hypothetical protein
MSERHLTPAVLDDLRTKQLRGPALVEALRHLGGCNHCSQRALATTGVTKLAPLQFDEEEAQPSRRRTLVWAAAAAIAAMISIIVFFAVRPSSVPVVQPTASSTPSTPKKVPEPRPAQPQRPAEWESLVAVAVTSGQLPYPNDLAALAGSPDVLRSRATTAAGKMTPAGVVIDDVRPQFTWPAVRGATYVVSIFEGNRDVAVSPRVTVNEWRPVTALARGRTYAWQVEVFTDGDETLLPAPEDPQALFRIASSEDHEAIEEARRRFPDDHILHAVLYARAGLRRDAEQALQRARATDSRGPARSPTTMNGAQ